MIWILWFYTICYFVAVTLLTIVACVQINARPKNFGEVLHILIGAIFPPFILWSTRKELMLRLKTKDR